MLKKVNIAVQAPPKGTTDIKMVRINNYIKYIEEEFGIRMLNSGGDDLALFRFGGPGLQGSFLGIIDGGEFRDADHVEDLFKMVRDACYGNLLIIFFDLGEKLNEQCNAAAVDISFFIAFQNNFLCAQAFGFIISVI